MKIKLNYFFFQLGLNLSTKLSKKKKQEHCNQCYTRDVGCCRQGGRCENPNQNPYKENFETNGEKKEKITEYERASTWTCNCKYEFSGKYWVPFGCSSPDCPSDKPNLLKKCRKGDVCQNPGYSVDSSVDFGEDGKCDKNLCSNCSKEKALLVFFRTLL